MNVLRMGPARVPQRAQGFDERGVLGDLQLVRSVGVDVPVGVGEEHPELHRRASALAADFDVRDLHEGTPEPRVRFGHQPPFW